MTSCDPSEIALKSLFMGPQAENAPWVLEILNGVFEEWIRWRRSLFPEDGVAVSIQNQREPGFVERRARFQETTDELMTRFEKEVPKFSPRYIGHMFSEISLPALVGHIATLLHNPNNISGESSRVGIQIEREAIGFLSEMIGFEVNSTEGHFTSGGTVANLEALVRARSRYALWMSAAAALTAAGRLPKFDPFSAAHMGWKVFESRMQALREAQVPDAAVAAWNMELANPLELHSKLSALSGSSFLGPVLLVPENMHYSWKKGAHLLGLGSAALWSIELDERGRSSVAHVRKLLAEAEQAGRPVLLVVSVVGTTELGTVDPVDRIQDVLDEWCSEKGIEIWHHVDAAFGGFFCSLDLERSRVMNEGTARSLGAIRRANSVTLDPHKLGYVPYSSGAFLSRDRRDYYFRTFEDAPYIDFDSKVDRGPYTLEGSRSAAGAVATWMTAKTVGLGPSGYGLLLERTIRIRRDLALRFETERLPVQVAPGADTNILCFHCGRDGEPLSVSNRRTLEVFESFTYKKNGDFIVSKTTLRDESYGAYLEKWEESWSAKRDVDQVVLIRLCLMNPFFESIESSVDYAELFVQCLRQSLDQCHT